MNEPFMCYMRVMLGTVITNTESSPITTPSKIESVFQATIEFLYYVRMSLNGDIWQLASSLVSTYTLQRL